MQCDDLRVWWRRGGRRIGPWRRELGHDARIDQLVDVAHMNQQGRPGGARVGGVDLLGDDLVQ
eukprot:624027-Prymnesium_polylepis.1